MRRNKSDEELRSLIPAVCDAAGLNVTGGDGAETAERTYTLSARETLIVWIDSVRAMEMPSLSSPMDAGGPAYWGEVRGLKAAANTVAGIIGYAGKDK